jgi:metal-responsive CopG/Arc/MetJ family transcriptional regulator
MKQSLIDRIDRMLSHKTDYKPRHTWILEAIADKLARDTPQNHHREALNGTPVTSEDQ